MKRIERYKDMTDEQFKAFEKAVEKLWKEMIPQDYDGDRPVQFLIVDRRKYEPIHWFLVPHDVYEEDMTPDQLKKVREEAWEAMVFNAHTAAECLYREMQQQRFRNHEAEQKKRPIEEQIKGACRACSKGLGFDHPQVLNLRDPNYPKQVHEDGSLCQAFKLRRDEYNRLKKEGTNA